MATTEKLERRLQKLEELKVKEGNFINRLEAISSSLIGRERRLLKPIMKQRRKDLKKAIGDILADSIAIDLRRAGSFGGPALIQR